MRTETTEKTAWEPDKQTTKRRMLLSKHITGVDKTTILGPWQDTDISRHVYMTLRYKNCPSVGFAVK